MNKRAIEGVKSNLRYIEEDVASAISHAKEIKDPELTSKLNKLQSDAKGVKDYIVSKTDAKTAG